MIIVKEIITMIVLVKLIAVIIIILTVTTFFYIIDLIFYYTVKPQRLCVQFLTPTGACKYICYVCTPSFYLDYSNPLYNDLALSMTN